MEVAESTQIERNFSKSIPSQHVLQTSFNKLKSNEDNGKKLCAKIGDKYFDLDAITKCLSIMKRFGITREVKEETEWARKLCRGIEKPTGTTDIDRSFLMAFIDKIQENSDLSFCPVTKLRISEIKSLVGNRWIHGAVLDRITDLINLQSDDTFAFNFNLCENIERVPEKIASIYMKKGGNPNKFVFYLHVVHVAGKTYIGNVDIDGVKHKANHFAMGVYDRKSSILSYGDSLGYPIPENLECLFQNFLSLISGPMSVPKLVMASCHSNERLPQPTHTCNRFCWNSFPLQKDQSICGIATIMCMCLAAFEEASFNSLRDSSIDKAGFCYLKNVSQYNDFLRFTVCKWLMLKTIDLSMCYAAKGEDSSSIYLDNAKFNGLEECMGQETLSAHNLNDVSEESDSTIVNNPEGVYAMTSKRFFDVSHVEEPVDYAHFVVSCKEGDRKCNEKANHFHCALCPLSRSVAYESKIKRHIESTHLNIKRTVMYEGLQIIPCKLSHEIKTFKKDHVFHYHCPVCGVPIQQKKFFENHLNGHKNPKRASLHEKKNQK